MSHSRTIHSTLARSRRWIFGGHQYVYTANFLLDAGDLCVSSFEIIRLAKESLVRNGKIQNFKGSARTDKNASLTNTLFSLSGVVLSDFSESTSSHKPLTFSVLTPFLKFEGANEVVHSVEEHRSISVPEWLPNALIPAVPGIQISEFIFGVERYEPSFITSLLKFIPATNEELLISANRNELKLSFTFVAKDRENATSRTHSSYLTYLQRALLDTFSFNFIEDLRNRLKIM